MLQAETATILQRHGAEKKFSLVKRSCSSAIAIAGIVVYITTDGIAREQAVVGRNSLYLHTKIFIGIGSGVTHTQIDVKRLAAHTPVPIGRKRERVTLAPCTTYRLIGVHIVAAAAH